VFHNAKLQNADESISHFVQNISTRKLCLQRCLSVATGVGIRWVFLSKVCCVLKILVGTYNINKVLSP